MLKKIYRAVKSVDIFGSQITFRHDNQIKYKSIGGGSATLFSIGFIIYLFYYFSYDCINKINPKVRDNYEYKIHNYVDMSKYFWAFYFTHENMTMIENPERYLAFHGLVTTWNETLEVHPLQFSKCNIKKHFSRTSFKKEQIFEMIPHFNDALCLDLEDDFYLLNGNTQIPRVSIDIVVAECENKTIKEVDYNNKCAPKEEIDKILSNLLINSFFADSYVDSDDYEMPNKQNIKTDSMFFSNADYCAILYVGHKNSVVIRDRGWLFTDDNFMSNLKIVSYIPDAVPSTQKALGINILFNIVLYADHTNTVTYIKYTKIQDVLANLGGIINFCKLSWVIIFAISNYFDISFDLYCHTYLNNKNFTIKCENENESNLQTINLNSIISENKSTNKYFQTTKIKKIDKIEKKVLLRPGFCKFFCSYLNGNSKDYNKLNIIHSKIRFELEVSNYLKLREDIYIMKSILFNNDERKIFNQIIDFREVCKVFKKDIKLNPNVYEDYLKLSYIPEKPFKNINNISTVEIFNKLKSKFHSNFKPQTSMKKTDSLKENNYMKNEN